MLNKSTIETGNYQSLKKLNLPRTEQINFNGKLNKVANKYKTTDPKLYKALKVNICSEPMPCPVYCLPKDHKDGDLKGRPIHSATDTPATSLSKFLAKSLNTLLRHVPAHLKNTEEFIDFLSGIDVGDTVHGFCSLDVCNLYGSIPLEDINTKTPSVFTVARHFFGQHKIDCELVSLSDEDFETLLRLCLTSDNVLIDGNGYKQKSGLAMGNNLAPSLAIIYMDDLDSKILDKADGNIRLKRYIDDYFVLLLSRQISGESLLTMSNNLNDVIKFTLELPDINKQLPYLDTMVSFNPESKTFSTKLYAKPIHSKCITPWDSHGSIASKRSILVGETRRAISRSTDITSQRESLRNITELFVCNGYPKKFVKSVMRYTQRNQPRRKDDDQKYIYLKLPFINEELKRRALDVIRRSGLSNIKVHFMNGKPSSIVFAPPREKLNCSDKCETCKSAIKPNRCLTKNVVYEIMCSHCGMAYIGETSRTIGSRIKEHLKMDKQTVHQHLKTHKDISLDNSAITWKILHANIRYLNERRCIEAFEIQKHPVNTIMNGCIGRTIGI